MPNYSYAGSEEIICKGKAYGVNSQKFEYIEKKMEDTEEEIRERLTSAAEERFDLKQAEEIEEEVRSEYEGILHGAALDSKIEKQKQKAWEKIKAGLEKDVASEMEDYLEYLLTH